MFAYTSDEETLRPILYAVHRTQDSGFATGPVQEWIESLPAQGGSEWRPAALTVTEVAMHKLDLDPGPQDPAMLESVPDNTSAWDLHDYVLTAWQRCGAQGVQHVLEQADTVACEGAALLLLLGRVNLEGNPESPRVQQWNAYLLDRIQGLEYFVGRARAPTARSGPPTPGRRGCAGPRSWSWLGPG